MIKNDPNYFYLNIGDLWPKFQLTGLEIAMDGALQLRALTRLSGDPPEGLAELTAPTSPAGVARADDGTLFFTEPDEHRLWRIAPCDAENKARPAACVGGEGGDATQFKFPRGLLFLPGRGLLIADSGNNRIQIIDPATSQVREIWDGIESNGKYRLNKPWAIVADGENDIYVLVAGDHSLQKLDQWGRIDRRFRLNVDASSALHDPVAIAITGIDGEERVVVLDRGQRALVVFNRDGRWRKTFEIEDPQSPPDISQSPLTLAISKRAIYVGHNGRRNILQFDIPALKDDRLCLVGAAVGFNGPTAALYLDCKGARPGECCNEAGSACSEAADPCDLLLLTGDGKAPLAVKEGAGYRDCGFAVTEPFDYRRRPVIWHRLKAYAETLGAREHVRFFFLLGDSLTIAPMFDRQAIALCRSADEVFKNWRAFPLDATEGIFESFITEQSLNEGSSNVANIKANRSPAASTYLRLGIGLAGDGAATPRIHQIRVEFDYASYLPYLPAFYSEDRETRQVLAPTLSLFESFFNEQESAIANLQALFDPESSKSEFLAWLAEWVAQDIEEGWSDDRKRRMIAKAFAAYATRGTPGGLRRRIQDFADLQVHLIEPLVNSGLWSLGESSVLNFDTSLAAAEAQGAVVGLSATLDHSYIITEAEFGAPLFEELAHRFSVVVYPNAASSPQRLAKLKSVIERDKPAHTDYHICIVQPKMRVGFQSTLGIDTVIGGPATPTPLADQSSGGLVLAGPPPAKLGEGAQVGVNAQLR